MKKKKPTVSSRKSIKPITVFFILLAVQIILAILLFDPKLFTGGDNAVYINLGQALLQGKGYRDLNKPDEPIHTQYPPGFPLMLAAVMMIFGQSIIALKLFIMLCGLTAFYLFFLLSREFFKEKYYLAMVAYALMPVLIIYYHWLLSEIPFLLLNLTALFLLIKAEKNKSFYYLSFLCAYFAFFTRTTGIALILAVLVLLLIRKRHRELVVFLSGFIILFAAWTISSGHQAQTGGYLDQFFYRNYYQPELGRINLIDFLRRIAHNFFLYFFTILPQSLFTAVKNQTLLAALGLMTIGLVIYGFVLRRRQWSAMEIYLIFGLAILLSWPEVWSSDRFLLPLLPVLIIYAVVGLLNLRQALAYARPALAVFFLLTNLWAILDLAPPAVAHNLEYLRGDRYAGYSADWRRYFETIEWLKANTPGSSVILARKPEFVYLLAKRKSFIYPYTSDRRIMEQSIQAADYILLDQFSWTGTTRRYLLPVLQADPDRYEIVYQTPRPEFYVLKIKHQP